MKNIQLSAAWFQGVVSVERGKGYLQPWRLPFENIDLFPSPNDALRNAASHASGTRLRFQTDTSLLRLDYEPHSVARMVDLTRNNQLLHSLPLPPDSESATFPPLSGRSGGTFEIWLPHNAPIRLRAMAIDRGRTCKAVPDTRPRWITYGSSITHCARAHSPARTWPAIAARHLNLHLTALGYGGQCHMDTLIAMMIRDMPARVITLKLGINMMNGSFNARSFEPAVIGLVRIIREKHPRIPMGLVSSICCPPRETAESPSGMTLVRMREAMVSAAGRLRRAGDRHLYDFNGLDIFDDALIRRHSPDLCHPDADGIEWMGQRFLDTVMTGLPLPGGRRVIAHRPEMLE